MFVRKRRVIQIEGGSQNGADEEENLVSRPPRDSHWRSIRVYSACFTNCRPENRTLDATDGTAECCARYPAAYKRRSINRHRSSSGLTNRYPSFRFREETKRVNLAHALDCSEKVRLLKRQL